jgi:transposase-like protein
MAQKRKKTTSSGLSQRKPWQRLDGALKARIVREILNGSVGYREASRKYNVHRTMLAKWVEKATVDRLLNCKYEADRKMLEAISKKE